MRPVKEDHRRATRRDGHQRVNRERGQAEESSPAPPTNVRHPAHATIALAPPETASDAAQAAGTTAAPAEVAGVPQVLVSDVADEAIEVPGGSQTPGYGCFRLLAGAWWAVRRQSSPQAPIDDSSCGSIAVSVAFADQSRPQSLSQEALSAERITVKPCHSQSRTLTKVRKGRHIL